MIPQPAVRAKGLNPGRDTPEFFFCEPVS